MNNSSTWMLGATTSTRLTTRTQVSIGTQVMLFSVVGCVSFLCNSLIFLVIAFNRRLHTKTNALLISLAFTDWLIIVVGIPFQIINLLNNGPLTCSSYCDTTGFLLLVPFLVSNFNMVLIALHRFILVVKNKYYKTICRTAYMKLSIFIIWAFGILVSIPPFFGWGSYDYNVHRSQCMIFWKGSISYLFFIQIIAFPLPLTIMIYCYYKVISHSYASRKRLQSSADRHNLSNQKRELALTLMLLVILCVFFVLFFPYAIIIYLEGVFNFMPSPTFNFLAILLAYSNSMFDFWIYAAMSHKFRKGLVDIFRRSCKHRTALKSRVCPVEESSSFRNGRDFHSRNLSPELSMRRRCAMNGTVQNNMKLTSFYKTDNVKDEYDVVSDIYIGGKPKNKVTNT